MQMGGLWVQEYLRTFTAQQGRTPLHAEQAHILHEQLRLQDATAEQARQQHVAWVFCDTAPLLTAIYSDCVFGDASQYAEALALHARYANTLLLEPDIPWVADGLQRDGAAMRATVHVRIQNTLARAGLPFTCIAGDAARRLQDAMNAING